MMKLMATSSTGDPFDKAGGYAIQHALRFARCRPVSGCYAGVMGLPLGDLQTLLGRVGVILAASLPAVCEAQGATCCCRLVNRAQ